MYNLTNDHSNGKKHFQRSLLNFFFCIFLTIILAATILSYLQINKLDDIRKWIEHTHLVIRTNNEILTGILSLQAEERGYIITNDRNFIADFDSKIQKEIENLEKLAKLVTDNEEQKILVKKLNLLILRIINSYKEAVQLKSENKLEMNYIMDLLHKNKEAIDRIDDISAEIYGNEVKLLQERGNQLDNHSDFIIIFTSCIYLIDIVFLVLIIVLFNRLLSNLSISQKKSELSEALIRGIIDSSRDYIGALNLDYDFVAFNEAFAGEFQRIFGKKISIGTNIKQILAHLPEQQIKVINLWRRALAGEQFSVIEKFGTGTAYGNYEITYNPIYNEESQLIGASVVAREVGKLIEEEIKLKNANQKLEKTLRTIEMQAQEMINVNEMNNRLRSSISLDETLKILTLYIKKLIPNSAGILYVQNASKNYLEALSEWGKPKYSEKIFSPSQCLGLREGKLYHYVNDEESILCRHIVAKGSPTIKIPPYLCIPLQAMNEVVGILFIQFPNLITATSLEINQLFEKSLSLIQNLSGQIALSISNMKLYELLKVRSTRDVLTNLYNRSYLLETFDRDIQRSKRNNTPIVVSMMDLDHFKDINDKYGHETGDVVLKEIANLIFNVFRTSDICCRYGGEEILIIMYDTDLDNALNKIEHLRRRIAELKFHFVDLVTVTASFGVAQFPQDGENSEALIKSADDALYQSKNAGRNRITIYKKPAP